MKRYLAIDLGASNGRHIVGWSDGKEILTDKVYGFENGVMTTKDGLVWDIEGIFTHVLEGIKVALQKYPDIESVAIDTWGVDYVRFKGDEPQFPCFSYRDERTFASSEAVHKIIPFNKIFEKAGIMYNNFNTVYQLYDDLIKGRLDGVTDFLSIPEYLNYKLTGVKKKEYTFATTTSLVNAYTKQFDLSLTDALGFPKEMFKPLYQPGEVVGYFKQDVVNYVGKNLPVVMCASHDTASAVEGIPIKELDGPYLSSGTWSIIGVKSDIPHTDKTSLEQEFSNEGGVGYIRYQKNTMGMWIVQSLRKELCPDKDYSQIALEASESDYDVVIDVNDQIFFSPKSMKVAIDEFLSKKGLPPAKTHADYFKCAYVGIAHGYKQAMKGLQSCTGKTYDKIYIVGGGAKNQFLNALTESICNVSVVAYPIEATALGNIKIQMER